MKALRIIFVVFIIAFLSGCSLSKIDDIEKNSKERLSNLGFDIVGREGTKYSIMGGQRWYVVKRHDSNGIYHVMLQYMVSGDLGVYCIESIDSVNVKTDNAGAEK